MNKWRYVAAYLLPPFCYIVWVAFDSWHVLAAGHYHPLKDEFKLLVLPWLTFTAPAFAIICMRGWQRYWQFLVAALIVGPLVLTPMALSAREESSTTLGLLSLAFAASTVISPVSALVAWLIAAVGSGADNVPQQRRSG